MENRKNGKIELLRFIFCLVIVFFHIGEHFIYGSGYKFLDRFDFTFFGHGMIAVEFFFLVSGFLMAKSVSKQIKNKKSKIKSNDLAKETYTYLKRKVASLFPEHTVAFIIALICASLFREYGILEMIRCFIASIPHFFFMQMTGIRINDTYPNNVEWYISAMLVAILLIYPLLRKYYEGFSKFGAPIIAIFVLGYLTSEIGYISMTTVWKDFFMVGTLRAIGIICLGICSYEIVKILEQKTLSKKTRTTIMISEIFLLITSLLYILSELSKKYEVIIVFLLFLLVTFSFSKKSLYAEKFDNVFFDFLGKMSLPIYLSHLPAINLVKTYFWESEFYIQVLLTLVITIVFTTITYHGGKLIRKIFKKEVH